MPELVQLWRYPVKSLGGEALDAIGCDAGGLRGDRGWAMVDGNGTVVTAKRESRLLHTWSALVDDGVRVGVPGLVEPVPVAAAGEPLSAFLGYRVRPVQWGRTAVDASFDFGFPLDGDAHSFSDCGDVLHLVSTATLHAFGGEQFDLAEAVRRCRPNLVIDCGERPFVEDDWLGRTLQLGAVRLRVAEPTVRCTMIDRSQPGMPARDLLDAVFGARAGQLGVYAAVEHGGTLAPGPVEVLG